MKYDVLVKYAQLGEVKMIRTHVYGTSVIDASRSVAPAAEYECYVTNDVAITIPRSSVLSIQVSQSSGVSDVN